MVNTIEGFEEVSEGREGGKEGGGGGDGITTYINKINQKWNCIIHRQNQSKMELHHT